MTKRVAGGKKIQKLPGGADESNVSEDWGNGACAALIPQTLNTSAPIELCGGPWLRGGRVGLRTLAVG